MAEETEELLLEDEAPPEEQVEQQEQQDDGEFHIELEGDEPEAEETPAIRALRKELRDKSRELDGYRKAAAPKPIEVGEKPTLDGCDYDEERFANELEQWNDRKRQRENAEADAAKEAEVRNEQWNRTLDTHRRKAAALPVKDYAEAEAAVVSALPQVLQSALVAYTDDSAKLVYALHKHPAQLAKLAQETDPIKFVIAARDMEKRIKTDVQRKAPPAPEAETIQRGTGVITPGMTEAKYREKLGKLEEKAAATGNRNEIIAFKAQYKDKFK